MRLHLRFLVPTILILSTAAGHAKQRYSQAGGQGYVSENAFWWPARQYEGVDDFATDNQLL